ncbi:MAG: alanine racemase [Ignavibacteria bacterium]|nr:alanine racemase [Ignavibacteria bacterium]
MSLSRRAFLASGISLPALSWSSLRVRMPLEASSSFDPWVEISADHLRHNIVQITKRVGSRPILAVIKNNGYGLGLENVARVLAPLPEVTGFAVVKLREAVALRDAGIVKPILLLGPVGEAEIEETVARGITLMVYTPVGPLLDRVSRKLRRVIGVQICIDTGIGRVGVPFQEAASLVRDLAGRRSVRIEGTMMTFTEDPDFDREQLRRFRSVCDALEQVGIDLGRKHAASSFALFQHPDSFLDMVRPGMAIFGIYPEPEFRKTRELNLLPAVSLKTRVVYSKLLPRGESAGYNRVFRVDHNVWVATLPVGHADGLPRVATKGGKVRIGNALYPIVAISASHIIVETGTEQKVQIGDLATIFDWQEGSRPEDFCSACGASVYDLTMHLNALLPRHVI